MTTSQETHGARRRPAFMTGVLATPGLLVSGYVWLLLFVILSIPLWVAFVAAGGTLAAYALLAGALAARGFGRAAAADPQHGDIVVGDDGIVMNPLVDARALRVRFMLALGMTLMSGWLIVETLAFSVTTQRDISFACGIAVAAFGLVTAVAYTLRPRERKQSLVIPALKSSISLWQALGAIIAGLGAWQIVETLVFSSAHARWLTFENACAYLGLALFGLVVHEFSSEHVVHVLEVAGWRTPDNAPQRAPDGGSIRSAA